VTVLILTVLKTSSINFYLHNNNNNNNNYFFLKQKFNPYIHNVILRPSILMPTARWPFAAADLRLYARMCCSNLLTGFLPEPCKFQHELRTRNKRNNGQKLVQNTTCKYVYKIIILVQTRNIRKQKFIKCHKTSNKHPPGVCNTGLGTPAFIRTRIYVGLGIY